MWCYRLQTGQESGETRETTREFHDRRLDNTTILLGLSPNLRPVMNRLVRVIANAISRRPVTAEARGQYQANSCGFFCGESGPVTGPYPNTSAFSFQYGSTIAPHSFIHTWK